jgi:hypothetical protein
VGTMPSLVLLSRTRSYSILRVGGAVFAGFASVGWIAEQLLDVHSAVDVVVNSTAHYAVWIAGVLFLVSVVRWSVPDARDATAQLRTGECQMPQKISEK